MRVALSLAPLFLTGCFILPHVDQDAPAIRGVVGRDERAVAGARVVYDVNAPACSSDVTTTTDAAGRFAFDRRTHFTPFLIFGDRRDSWDVCIQEPNGLRSVWTSSDWWGGPPEQDLACDLATPPGKDPCKVTSKGRP